MRLTQSLDNIYIYTVKDKTFLCHFGKTLNVTSLLIMHVQCDCVFDLEPSKLFQLEARGSNLAHQSLHSSPQLDSKINMTIMLDQKNVLSLYLSVPPPRCQYRK